VVVVASRFDSSRACPTAGELLALVADNRSRRRRSTSGPYQFATEVLFESAQAALGSQAAAEGAHQRKVTVTAPTPDRP